MPPVRVLMIGGFLGAGKTTALARLASSYVQQGLNVCLVTNDQAYGLVDTASLRAQGFYVGEVPGACFCCKFDELVDTLAKLTHQFRPDVVLTEPVGSCTDLMATVVRPIAHLYGGQYEVGPLAVLCKPEHGIKILGDGQTGFSPQAAYIFRKQLEEAEVIVLNKIDKLSDLQRETLLRQLEEQYPNRQLVAASARTGAGFDALVAALAVDAVRDGVPMDVDYDTYAAGEAEMGWLNATVRLTVREPRQPAWPLDAAALELVEACRAQLQTAEFEPGHLKVLASATLSDGGLATTVANWVAADAPVELSVTSQAEVQAADLLVNGRVAGEPARLAEIAAEAARAVAVRRDLECHVGDVQQFRPARPEPTHRFGEID